MVVSHTSLVENMLKIMAQWKRHATHTRVRTKAHVELTSHVNDIIPSTTAMLEATMARKYTNLILFM